MLCKLIISIVVEAVMKRTNRRVDDWGVLKAVGLPNGRGAVQLDD